MPRKKKSVSPKRSIIASSLVFMFKLGLVLLTLTVLYAVYLDSKVTALFEGDKWQLPAQVYAKPYDLYPGKTVSVEILKQRLARLGYRPVGKVTDLGQYRIKGNSVEVYRRAYDDYNGRVPALRFIVSIDGEQVSHLQTVNREDILSASLEPELIARLSSHEEDREFWPLSDVPKRVTDTLLLVEDRKFYSHHGVSPLAIARAFYHNIKAGRTVEGGSTLTQQLAKNMYLSRERSLIRKFNEALIALILDARYSKDQILEAYINEVFMGQDGEAAVHGLPLAAKLYFGKPINELAVDEVASLIGIIKGPSFYDPRRRPERVMQRRDVILQTMRKHDYIDDATLRQALNKKITISNRAQVRTTMPAYMDMVRRELDALFDKASQQNGLKVFTYLDSQLQQSMEKAHSEGVPHIEKRFGRKQLQAASVSVEVTSGGVAAMVGSRAPSYAGLNRALDMKRNIGSLVKPAVFYTALAKPELYHLYTPLLDAPLEVLVEGNKRWYPKNYDNQFRGKVPLQQALRDSLNLPTVRIGLEVGLANVAQSLSDMGFTAPNPIYPSALLGAIEASPLGVAQAYLTLAKQGKYQQVTPLLAVTSKQGQLLWQHQPTSRRQMNEAATYLTNFALQHVSSQGTAKRLKQQFPYANIAAKTGTTDDLRDSWFAAFDQQFVTVNWLGKDDFSPAGVSGSNGALELYIRTFNHVEVQSRIDERPKGIELRYFDAQSGEPSRPGCDNLVMAPAVAAHVPVPSSCPGSWFNKFNPFN